MRSISAVRTRAFGARNHSQNSFAVLVTDHAGEKAARGLASAGTDLVQHAADA